MPAKSPIARIIPRLATTPEVAPLITPPAKLAFKISYILNFFLKIPLMANVERQLAVKHSIVLQIINDL